MYFNCLTNMILRILTHILAVALVSIFTFLFFL